MVNYIYVQGIKQPGVRFRVIGVSCEIKVPYKRF